MEITKITELLQKKKAYRDQVRNELIAATAQVMLLEDMLNPKPEPEKGSKK